MLCLIGSIRDDDPSVQYLLRVLEDASSLTALILAAWQIARVLAVYLAPSGRILLISGVPDAAPTAQSSP